MKILSIPEYKQILRADFLSFAVRAFYELNPAETLSMSPHIALMAAKLEATRLGRIPRLIINGPPRGFKSHLASVALPAWFLGHEPSGKVAVVCYGQELAEKFARDCRRLMQSRFYQALFRTRISDRQAVHDFETTQGGVRFATSFGGPFTGRGAALIIVDDPTKADDVLSESRRTSANMWFDNTLLSRLDDKTTGRIVIIMQRQHQDDLVGHVLERGGWESVVLPTFAIQDETHRIETPLGTRVYTRRAGEPLHPERESEKMLVAIRAQMGEFTFAAQYQQTPIPLEGAIVKPSWLRYYKPGEEPARFNYVLQSWDTANKATELNDYTVCVTFGISGKFCYLLDVFRERLTYPEQKRKVIELAQRYQATIVVIEDKASGIQLIQDLKYELYGVKPYEPLPGMDKEVRLRVQTTFFEQGFVFLPEAAPWLNEYVAELTGFPGTRYDDQVDATAHALACIRESNSTLQVWATLGEGPGFPPLPQRVIPWSGPQFFGW